jgi:hypothetical protein
MPLTFEELADAGLPAKENQPKQSTHFFLKSVLVLFLTIVLGGLIYFFCFYKLTPKLPESMEDLIVLDVDVPDGVMPHQFDVATEFQDSLQRHKIHYEKPEYRETPLAAKAVPAVPSPDDIQLARAASESKWHGVAPFFSNSIDKVEDTWSQFIGEPEVVQTSEVAGSESSQLPDKPLECVQFTAKPTLEDIQSNHVVPTSESLAVNTIELSPDSEVQFDFVRDWDGLVLIPNDVQLARAYTNLVRLDRVEAHPIDGGRLRVWVRIENMTSKDLEVDTACEFRFKNQDMSPTNFAPSLIPANGALDVYYISARDGVCSYTIMVKR